MVTSPKAYTRDARMVLVDVELFEVTSYRGEYSRIYKGIIYTQLLNEVHGY